MLTAADEGNDVIALFERIFPIQPETYQVVKKDDADFQYAYLLHYTATIWDVKAAVYGENRGKLLSPRYRQPAGYAHPHEPAEPEYAGTPSRGFHVVSPVTAKKTNGHLFYEWTIAKSLVINGNPFTETIHCLAWQHGDTMEVAAILGNIAKEGDDDIISAVTDMLKNAEKMPKK